MAKMENSTCCSVTGIVTRTWDELKYIPRIGERQGRELIKEMQKIVIYRAVTGFPNVIVDFYEYITK